MLRNGGVEAGTKVPTPPLIQVKRGGYAASMVRAHFKENHELTDGQSEHSP